MLLKDSLISKKSKQQLSNLSDFWENTVIDPESIFDIQKRLHEYKRQLLNAFSILYIYYGIKDGSIKHFFPTTFIFGAKSAPGYRQRQSSSILTKLQESSITTHK